MELTFEEFMLLYKLINNNNNNNNNKSIDNKPIDNKPIDKIHQSKSFTNEDIENFFLSNKNEILEPISPINETEINNIQSEFKTPQQKYYYKNREKILKSIKEKKQN